MSNGYVIGVCLFVLTLMSGCASSAQPDEQQRAKDARIEEILSGPVDDAAYGKALRCLNSAQYRSFRVLDDRHIVFEGSRDRLWLNTLRMRCPDLRHATALRVRSLSAMGRVCDLDTFQAGDWFDWPWYRRWPWRWGARWPSGISCTLGAFQPVTRAQLAAIETALRQR